MWTVLARRERSLAAVAGAGSTLAALPRDAGREEALDGGRLSGGGACSGAGVGVAAADIRLRVTGGATTGCLTSFFESFFESLVGGRMGVAGFLGDAGKSVRFVVAILVATRTGSVGTSSGVGGTDVTETLLK